MRVSVAILIIALLSCATANAAELLFGSTGGIGSNSANPGSIFEIDPATGAATVLASPYGGSGISGLAANAAGRVFASTSIDAAGFSHLIEIDPLTGDLIADVGPMRTALGHACTVGDLSFQSGSDVLFGISSNNGPVGEPRCDDSTTAAGGYLVTIDTVTAGVTVIGRDPSFLNQSGGLAFAPDGTLYFTAVWEPPFSLYSLDPSTGNVLTVVPLALGRYFGLAVRPSDGLIFASNRRYVDDDNIYTIDPSTGAETVVGSPSPTQYFHDLTFLEGEPRPPTYSCVGFDPPMNRTFLPPALGGSEIARKVKRNRVFPLHATLVDAEHNVVTDLIAAPEITVGTVVGSHTSIDVTEDALPPGKGTIGVQFTLAGNKWHYNLGTKGYQKYARSYKAVMISGDNSEYAIDPSCRTLFVIESR